MRPLFAHQPFNFISQSTQDLRHLLGSVLCPQPHQEVPARTL
jgi:hypothetical protein